MPGLTVQSHIDVRSSAHTPCLASTTCRVALMCDGRATLGAEIVSHALRSLCNVFLLIFNTCRKIAECI